MTTSTKLGLELLANSASNYLLANKTFLQVSQLLQMTVVTKTLSTPPGSPAAGAAYLVASSPTGAWTGKANQLAYWETSIAAWSFVVPVAGWSAYVADEALRYSYTGSDWRPEYVAIGLACSDESTPITVGAAKITVRMPYAFTLKAVRASLTVAQASGSTFTVDINEGDASVLSTKLTIDNTELSSTSAAAAAVISDSALADDAEITIDVDQIGDGTATGLKVWLIGTPA